MSMDAEHQRPADGEDLIPLDELIRRTQCSAAIALSGLDTSRLVRMKL